MSAFAVFSARGILQKVGVDVGRLDMDVADDGAADEHVGDAEEMWMIGRIDHLHLVQLDIEVLIDAMEYAFDLQIVLEFDGHFFGFQRFEE